MRERIVILNEEREVFRELLKYILPGIFGLLFNSLYIVVDGLFVARMLGREALAAVTVAVPIMEIMIALSMLISVGSGVLISKLKGENKVLEARKVFNTGVGMLLGISLFLAIFPQIVLENLVGFLGAGEELVFLTKDYLRYLFLLAPGFMFSYGLGTWLRNDNRPNITMVAQVVGALTNIFLDWFFMGPMDMGIKGAAIATGIGPLVAIAIMLGHFLKKKGDLYFERIKLEAMLVLDIVKNGAPSFSMEFALGITTLIMNLAISKHIGTLGLAVYGIIGYIALMVYSIFLGIGEGSQPLVSFYDGKNEGLRMRIILKQNIVIAFIVGIFSYIFLQVGKETVVRVFAGSDQILLDYTTNIIRYYFIALSITGVNIILSAYMQSVGKWVESIFLSLLRSFILLLPLVFLLPRFFVKESIWMGVALAEILTLLISLLTIYFRKNKLVSK